ncbi:hypothetical protein HanXRQr2_Chr07g0305511 [Helianthus annuus]|uniref:Uncharacterized protein n=1 Tax=Helianthus annuus TaxID=4232 RepID=A0A9K3IMC3_HELAN|nr:hypothetical protein HanXRQr2_Chr07g0305511 [Helianthus annuus]
MNFKGILFVDESTEFNRCDFLITRNLLKYNNKHSNDTNVEIVFKKCFVQVKR